MQTILGSGGAVGIELAKALKDYTKEIRLVSRNPEKVNQSDELVSADLLHPEAVKDAVKGSSTVYVTVGFPYNYKTWKESWPGFTKNVIDACVEQKSKLVFFDNIYMYDPSCLDGMTEETPINPPSRKGKIRAEIFQMIMREVEAGKLSALVARSADYYGPNIKITSLLTETVFNPLASGKRANWMASVDFKHSITYTPDAGKAIALLGNTDNAYNQVWHLPTAENPFTGKEWIEAIAGELGVEPRYQVASRPVLKLMGVFVPVLREMPEMLYQYDRDYVFNSEKFNSQFDLKPTPFLEGVRDIVKSDYK